MVKIAPRLVICESAMSTNSARGRTNKQNKELKRFDRSYMKTIT